MIYECVSLTIPITYIFSVSLKFGVCCIRVNGTSSEKAIQRSVYIYFFGIFFYLIVFHQKICFYHFKFFFDEQSNFRNRILTNQKPELVIRNCQWNCVLLHIFLIVYTLKPDPHLPKGFLFASMMALQK